VPRVLEKIFASLVRRGRELPRIQKKIYFWAIEIGHRYEFNNANGNFYNLKLFVARQLVFNKWKAFFGNNLKIIVSGGASLNPKLTRLFWASGFKVMEGYGLTETSPVIAVGNFLKGGVKFGTVGPVLPGVELRLASDGEILCKSPGLMLGYYNRPDRTSQAIDEEGWFHTGDIGELVEGKYLRITDRKKEMFKTSGGKYIAPQVIENLFKESSFIENIIVLGENRKHPAALIVPNMEFLKAWCEVKQIEFTTIGEAIKHPRIINRFIEEISSINQKLSHTEQIKKFRLIPELWSPESGELSPTLKLRRKFILEKYKKEIEKLYSSI
jgi:long-chain acyl-CoA synthetase